MASNPEPATLTTAKGNGHIDTAASGAGVTESNTAGVKRLVGGPGEGTGRLIKRVCYEKDLTVVVELEGEAEISAMALIRATRSLCGSLAACRMINRNKFELTVDNIQAKERLLDGFRVGETRAHARDITNDELVVSFMGLPAYIEDQDILDKLLSWGVTAVSAVRRRMWPGTEVADGTRFVKVRFTHEVQSLPYSARFITAAGPEFFRVIHDRQVRVCRGCLQPNHVLRECPDFLCRRCGGQGHYARECTEPRARRCESCSQPVSQCSCGADSGSELVESAMEEGEEEGGERREESTGGEGSHELSTEVGTALSQSRETENNVPTDVLVVVAEEAAPGVEEGAQKNALSLSPDRGAGISLSPKPNAGSRAAELRGGGVTETSPCPTPEGERMPEKASSSRSDSGVGDANSSQRGRSQTRRGSAGLSSSLNRAVGGPAEPRPSNASPIAQSRAPSRSPSVSQFLPLQGNELMLVDTADNKRKVRTSSVGKVAKKQR